MQRLIATFALIFAAPVSQAALLDFQFSFNDLENGTSVTGIIRGLMDDASGPASSVEVLTSTGGFGIGEFIGDPLLNDFRVYDGALEEAIFRSLGSANTTGVMDASLLFDIELYALCVTLPCPQVMSGALSPFADVIDIDHDSVVTFTPAHRVPVPLPASLILLGVGALLLGLLRPLPPGHVQASCAGA